MIPAHTSRRLDHFCTSWSSQSTLDEKKILAVIPVLVTVQCIHIKSGCFINYSDTRVKIHQIHFKIDWHSRPGSLQCWVLGKKNAPICSSLPNRESLFRSLRPLKNLQLQKGPEVKSIFSREKDGQFSLKRSF